MNFSGKGSKIIAGMITVAVLALLILAGPANAFQMSLNDFSNTNPTQGDKVSTTATITINTNERMPLINPIQLLMDICHQYLINGVICSFNVNGQDINCNEGVEVSLISSSNSQGYGYGYNFGYSYGYAYGYQYGYNGYGYQQGYSDSKFTYNITLDTAKFSIGSHDIKLSIDTGAKTYTSLTSITIKPAGAATTETKDNVAPNVTESFDNNKVLINLGGSTTGKVTVATFTSQPAGTSTFSLPGLGKYLQIETDIASDISGTMIKVYYTDAEVSSAGLDESTLRLYFYNSTSGTWQVYDTPNGGVDTTNNYVWAITNHFSIWGIFGSMPPATTTAAATSTSGGGGGCIYDSNYNWGCNEWGSCVNGQQTRACTAKTNNCGSTYGRPAVTQACTSPAGTTPAGTTPGGLAGITGAVIGALGTSGTIIIVIVVIAGLIGTAVTLSVRRFRKK